MPGESHRIGVTNDEADKLPDSQSHTGKTRRSLSHHWSAELRRTPPKLNIARPRFLCDGVLAQRE